MEQNNRFPLVRFKNFTDPWEQRKVKDLYIYAAEGGTPSTNNKSFYNGTIPFVKVDDCMNKYIYNTKQNISEKGVNHSSAWLIPENSIIYTNGATIGKIAINKVKVATKQGILGIVLNDKYNVEFIYYLLSIESFKKQIDSVKEIGTFATVILKNFSNINIIITTLGEQVLVGKMFSIIDTLITLHQRKYDLLNKVKKKFLQKMFVDHENSFPEIRFKGFTDAWEQRKVLEIANRYDNLRIPITARNRQPGKTPYYGANGIQDYVQGFTHDGEFILITEDGAKDLKNYPVYYVVGQIWVNNHAHVLKANENNSTLFIKYVINAADISSVLVGGSRTKLNSDVLMNFVISLPYKEEQVRIARNFFDIDNLITLHQRKCEILKKIKKKMLNVMFC